jgi:hypothetical protein
VVPRRTTALPVALTVSDPVPMVIVLDPLVGRTRVPNASALSWAIVTGWMMVVVPVVVAELVDCANAGVARLDSITIANAVCEMSFMLVPSEKKAAAHCCRLGLEGG